MKKTNAQKSTKQTTKRNVIALSPADMKAIHGGKGGIIQGPWW